MKRFFIPLLIVLLFGSVNAQNQDAFAPYQQYEAAASKKPVVPEPSTYGFVFILLTGSVLIVRKIRNQRTL